MKVTSELIFNTLVEQNILKSDLTYSQLIDSKFNILIKKKNIWTRIILCRFMAIIFQFKYKLFRR